MAVCIYVYTCLTNEHINATAEIKLLRGRGRLLGKYEGIEPLAKTKRCDISAPIIFKAVLTNCHQQWPKVAVGPMPREAPDALWPSAVPRRGAHPESVAKADYWRPPPQEALHFPGTPDGPQLPLGSTQSSTFLRSPSGSPRALGNATACRFLVQWYRGKSGSYRSSFTC